MRTQGQRRDILREPQPVINSAVNLTPLESLFTCSASDLLVGCSNAVDLQHLYDVVGSERSHESGSLPDDVGEYAQ